MSYERLAIYFDGACEPKNPGGVATYGWVIKAGDLNIADGKGVAYDGGEMATNNVAEYCGLGHALRWLVDQGAKVDLLEIFGDSKLVISQMNKDWQCKAPHLVKLRRRCFEYIEKVAKTVRYAWLPREQNGVADVLTRVAYTKHTGKPFPVRR